MIIVSCVVENGGEKTRKDILVDSIENIIIEIRIVSESKSLHNKFISSHRIEGKGFAHKINI